MERQPTFQYSDHLSFCTRGLMVSVRVGVPPRKRPVKVRRSPPQILAAVRLIESGSRLPPTCRTCSWAVMPVNQDNTHQPFREETVQFGGAGV